MRLDERIPSVAEAPCTQALPFRDYRDTTRTCTMSWTLELSRQTHGLSEPHARLGMRGLWGLLEACLNATWPWDAGPVGLLEACLNRFTQASKRPHRPRIPRRAWVQPGLYPASQCARGVQPGL